MAETKIVVTHNFQRLNSMLKGLGDKREIQAAVARSIKRTLPSVQKVAFQEIKSKKLLRLKASEVKLRARAYLEVGANKAVSSQYGKVWITPRPENLGKFFPRRYAAGRSQHLMGQDKYGAWNGVRLYSVKLNSYGAPYLKNPDRSFMVKRGDGFVILERMAGSKRLPLTKLWGPGMAELARQTGMITTLAARASARYQVEYTANLKFYVDRALQRAIAHK